LFTAISLAGVVPLCETPFRFCIGRNKNSAEAKFFFGPERAFTVQRSSYLAASINSSSCDGTYPHSRESAIAALHTKSARIGTLAWVMRNDGAERLNAAVLDRLTHRCHILEFRSGSFRLRQSLQKQSTKAHQATTTEKPTTTAATKTGGDKS
jgi:hypothetical protein